MGAGLWHPAGPTLAAIREAINEHPNRWTEVTKGLALGGESLKRAPRGIDPEHPLLDDLKRKDFVSFTNASQAAACKRGFLGAFSGTCEAAAPFVRFLTEAVGLEF